MIQLIKKLLGLGGPQVSFSELAQKGAVIVDVRTPAEFKGGHIKGAINIPLDKLQNQLSKIPKTKPVITCCASGARSASAKSFLAGQGYEVYNGGGWMSLRNKLAQ